ncbi:MAG: HNH endonuclease, partial [Nitrosopumilus sp.]|nr:HNH endonuclease [Nitrosopumilus sp.]
DILYKISSTFKLSENATRILADSSDEWLQNFYVLLGRAKEETRQKSYDWRFSRIEDAYIVRLQDGNYNVGKNTYFQTEILKKGKNLSISKPETYQSSKDTFQNEKAKAFLNLIGVKEFELRDEIKIILEEHYRKDSLKITEEENIKHLRKFVRFCKDYSDESSIFSSYLFIRVEDRNDGKIYYATPLATFIDEPYETTKLSNIKSFLNKNNKWKISSDYSMQIKNQEDFISFLKKVGVTFKLEIERTGIYGNPSQNDLRKDAIRGASVTEYSTNEDYKIKNLEDLLSEKKCEVSQLVWETVSKAGRNVLIARYSPNSRYQTQLAPSQLIHTLKQFAWIPDKEGNFHKPENITREMLPDNFPFNNGNGWLEAIGVGTQAQKNKIDEQEKAERAAKELGLSVEEAERAIEYAKLPAEERKEFEEFRQQKAKKKQSELTEIDETESESEDDYSETENNLTYDEEQLEENSDSDDIDCIVEFFESKSSISKTDESETEKFREKIIEKVKEERNKTKSLKISEIEKEQIVKSRVGQFLFRKNVEQIETECRLTNVKNKRFLIASHIKPWKECESDEEKLDGNNGLLLSPHVDKLFDKGWISFTDEGKILCANDEIKEIMKLWNLNFDKSVGGFNDEQKKYLDYHRKAFNFES